MRFDQDIERIPEVLRSHAAFYCQYRLQEQSLMQRCISFSTTEEDGKHSLLRLLVQVVRRLNSGIPTSGTKKKWKQMLKTCAELTYHPME